MPIAIVTGASKGFGRAVAVALAADGWDVVVDARSATDLAGAFAGARTVHPVRGDVNDPAHRQALVDTATRLGGLDLLVNNASTLGPSPLPALASYPLEALAEVYRTNVLAPLALIQAALPLLRAADAGGTIVDISSDAAVEAYDGWGGYGSSKAALDHATKVLAAEQPALHVFAFDPGDMRTQMHQDAFPGEDISDRPEPETVVPALLRLVRRRLPSGRYRASDLRTEAAPA